MNDSVLQALRGKLPSLRAGFRRHNFSRTEVSQDAVQPNPVSSRYQSGGMSKRWSDAVLHVLNEAAEAGKDVPKGETFIFKIPHSLIPRNYPGRFAMCLLEAGYEVALAPRVAVISTNGRKRSGQLTVLKV